VLSTWLAKESYGGQSMRMVIALKGRYLNSPGCQPWVKRKDVMCFGGFFALVPERSRREAKNMTKLMH